MNFKISQLTQRTCGALNRKVLLYSECYGPAVYAFANEYVKCHGNAFSRWDHLPSQPMCSFVKLLQCYIFESLSIKYSINDPSQVLYSY